MGRNQTGHALLGVDHLDLEPEVVKGVPSFRVIRSIPSMIRIHIPEWRNVERSALEHRLRVVRGVRAVHANSLTRSLVMRFEPPRGGRRRALQLIEAVLLATSASGP